MWPLQVPVVRKASPINSEPNPSPIDPAITIERGRLLVLIGQSRLHPTSSFRFAVGNDAIPCSLSHGAPPLTERGDTIPSTVPVRLFGCSGLLNAWPLRIEAVTANAPSWPTVFCNNIVGFLLSILLFIARHKLNYFAIAKCRANLGADSLVVASNSFLHIRLIQAVHRRPFCYAASRFATVTQDIAEVVLCNHAAYSDL